MARRLFVSALIAGGLALARPAVADTRAWLFGSHLESLDFVVPVILRRATNDLGHETTFWIVGWTAGADWKRATTPRRSIVTSIRATPINANSSNYIYRAGRRDEHLSYRAGSFEALAGLQFNHTKYWTGTYTGLMTYQRVDGLSDTNAQEFWSGPFGGIEITERYRRVTSSELLGARFEGVDVAGNLRALGGSNRWIRASLTAGAGRRLGRTFVSGRAAWFRTTPPNIVSDTIVGGSWTLDDPTFVPGYRYAEFRVANARTIVGGLSVKISGNWEVGTRAGSLHGDRRADGVTAEVRTVWRGIVLNGGTAWRLTDRTRSSADPLVFASIVFAVIE